MNDVKDTARSLEALLFTEGESVSYKRLSAALKCDMVELSKALDQLGSELQGRGIALIRGETEAALAIAPSTETVVREAESADTKGDIGEAGLEVLSIVLYRGPSTRADIDYIRGVNSSFTIRTLLARGLLERVRNPDDSREFLYRGTIELFAHLGIKEGSEAPDYATIAAELSAFEQTRESSGEHDTDRNQ